MSIRETQKLFSDALISTSWRDEIHPAEKLVRRGGALSARQRLEIYRSTGLTAQINALRQIYPVCEQILGERTFNNLARKYALSHQSLSPDLNLYGEDFSDYIDQSRQRKEFQDYKYLKDLCSLEWLWHVAYYAEDDVDFDFNAFQIASEQADDIVLNLSHALKLVETDYPTHTIWQQHRDREPKSSVMALQETQFLCIYREEYFPKIEQIDHLHYEFLQACKYGLSLQKISAEENYLPTIQAIPSFIQRRWICGFSTHSV